MFHTCSKGRALACTTALHGIMSVKVQNKVHEGEAKVKECRIMFGNMKVRKVPLPPAGFTSKLPNTAHLL